MNIEEEEKKNPFSDETFVVQKENMLPLSRISIEKYIGKGSNGQCYRVRFDTMDLDWVDDDL